MASNLHVLAKTDQHVTRLNITNKTWAPDEDEHKGLKSLAKGGNGLVGSKVKQPNHILVAPKQSTSHPRKPGRAVRR